MKFDTKTVINKNENLVNQNWSEELDGIIVWNAHNTVLGSKRLAVCATV